jgi:sigma-54 dependent transcriptional regulator, acetoin dehydrogenase operon transcriptional activator AcoR
MKSLNGIPPAGNREGHRGPHDAFSGSPHPGQEKYVMAAWDRFLRGVEVPPNVVRSVIERSWSRCYSAGVDPGCSHAQILAAEDDLRTLQHRQSDLLDASVPIMKQAHHLLSESGTMMVLTDSTGVILEAVGDPATLDAAQDIRLINGANWDELTCGTNGIGTALAVRTPVHVHAAEHFCTGMKPWSCAATVVRDPAHGEVLGVLDVSGLSGKSDQHWLALAVMTAGRIEAQLAAREIEFRHDLLEASLRHLSNVSPGGLMFFDRRGRLIKIGADASRSLAAMGVTLDSRADHTVEAFNAASAMRVGSPTLPEWLRPEWVEPVVRGGERLGTVVVLPDPSQRRTGRRALHSRAATLETGGEASSSGQIIGGSEALRRAVEKARQLADLDVPVLLQGETGVGKERFARAIHESGYRKTGPFVALNCGGLPRDILVSELFGYVDGAFTGARRSGMVGKIAAADGGTLFLDEIGDMPLELQPVFLRVLEGGEVYPLGDHKPRKVAFRLLAATNKDLRAEVSAGRFRQDLFYRVSATVLRVPSLRERKEDIPTLVEHFSGEVSRRYDVPMKPFEPTVLDAFDRYAWPGNVREIRNVVEGMVLLTTGDAVTIADLPAEIVSSITAVNPAAAVPVPSLAVTDLEAVERDAISAAIATRHGNLTLVARELRISKSTLYLKVEKYGLGAILREARAVRATG